eukprot:sb/3478814/
MTGHQPIRDQYFLIQSVPVCEIQVYNRFVVVCICHLCALLHATTYQVVYKEVRPCSTFRQNYRSYHCYHLARTSSDIQWSPSVQDQYRSNFLALIRRR